MKSFREWLSESSPKYMKSNELKPKPKRDVIRWLRDNSKHKLSDANISAYLADIASPYIYKGKKIGSHIELRGFDTKNGQTMVYDLDYDDFLDSDEPDD